MKDNQFTPKQKPPVGRGRPKYNRKNASKHRMGTPRKSKGAEMQRKAQTFLLLTCFLSYVLAGTVIFQLLEREHAREQQHLFLERKDSFLKNYTALSPEEVEDFIEYFSNSIHKGRILSREYSEEYSLWDFGNTFFFVGSTISTIGYGNRAPQTAGGQLFCVFFATFGIPMNVVFLQHVSHLLSVMCEKPARWFVGKHDKRTTKTLTLLLFLMMGILVFFCLPCMLFQHVEGWSFSESFYYSFITLSTIGFGDYVIGSQSQRKYFLGYQLLAMIWVVFGLAWIGLLFNLLAALLSEPEPRR